MATRPPPALTAPDQEALLTLHGKLLETFTDAASHDDKVKHITRNASPEKLKQWFCDALKNDHPDAFLRRFLIFTTNDASKAHSMVLKHLNWRKNERHIDEEILPFGEPGAVKIEKDATASSSDKEAAGHFLEQFRSGKAFTHGVDKEGRLVTYIRVKLHKISGQPPEIMEKFIIWHIENSRLSYGPGVESNIMVFDLEGFGMSNMDYKMIQFIIDTYTRYYPLGLGGVVIYKSPWIFSACWSIIKGLVPSDFQERIKFVKNATELESLVPKENILASMGGADDWTYSYTDPAPLAERTTEQKSEVERLQKERLEIALRLDGNTKEWIEAAKNGGDVNTVRNAREGIIGELKGNYWRLDPFVRAKGLYDSWGYIKTGQ